MQKNKTQKNKTQKNKTYKKNKVQKINQQKYSISTNEFFNRIKKILETTEKVLNNK